MKNVKIRWILFTPIILIIILGSVVYLNSLNGKFIWDDDGLIKDNFYIKDWSRLHQVFGKNIWAGVEEKSQVYRPLQIITYAADYSLWKLNVIGYHLTNILLHVLAAIILYLLINILFCDKLVSLLTSLLFVIHPIHTETVSYISARADPLAAVFILTAFLFYIICLKGERHQALWIIALVSYVFALLSRENALIFPAMVVLYHFIFREKIKIRQFLSILGIAVIYLLSRYIILSPVIPGGPKITTLSQRIPGFFIAITNYTRLLILPWDLHMEYGNSLFNLFDPRAILGLVITVSLLSYAFIKRNSNKLISFSILWFFIMILPSSNLYPLNAYMAEHWLYLPSIGFFLALAYGLTILYKAKGRGIFLLVFLGLWIFYSGLTIKQNNYWSGPIVFYERTLKFSPHSARVHNNLGLAYYRAGRKEEAIAAFKRALEFDPRHVNAYNNLGVMYRDMNRNEQALDLFKKALEIDPAYAQTYHNLGTVYYVMGKRKEAEDSYKKALEINPRHIDTYNNLGVLCRDTGKNDLAIGLFNEALRINPVNVDVYINLGTVYSINSRQGEAIASFKKAIEIDPDNAIAYNNLGVVLNNLGRKEEALELFKKSAELNPNYVVACFNLGLSYSFFGRDDLAIESYKKAIEAYPNHPLAENNIALLYYNKKQYTLAIKHCDRALELGFKVSPEFQEKLKLYRK